MTGTSQKATALPDWLVTHLNGLDLEGKSGDAIQIMTVDADGWPHLAQLSVGEILAVDPQRILFLTWPASTSSANLIRDGRIVLETVGCGAVWEIRLQARLLAENRTWQGLKAFSARVMSVTEHRAPYANVLRGLQFELIEPEHTHRRWREQINSLKRLAKAPPPDNQSASREADSGKPSA